MSAPDNVLHEDSPSEPIRYRLSIDIQVDDLDALKVLVGDEWPHVHFLRQMPRTFEHCHLLSISAETLKPREEEP